MAFSGVLNPWIATQNWVATLFWLGRRDPFNELKIPTKAIFSM
jgi:hypothetical protein